ncbi:MAG: AmmeMemoRadiSam system radical SAM enzyme [Bacteroidales bacterium]|nr:AmmeMemoRadiSam system radical SAM enzyme [Bacteroidales bacterium]
MKASEKFVTYLLMHEAQFYTKLSDARVRCDLCPHLCIISETRSGQCGVRSLHNGKLISNNYGRLSSIAMDPIEKKPLYHFYPGEHVFSIGSVGCNMHCKHCQNEQISQCIGIAPGQLNAYSVDKIVARIRSRGSGIVAFTYNEPVVSYEYMVDVADALKGSGIACVMVTNGYIMPGPLARLLPYFSGFNVDLKAFSDQFYKKITGARLQPVIDTLEAIKAAGSHLEITYLVIPGLNDDPEEFSNMIAYINRVFGRDQVLHLSRYFPSYQMSLPPTPLSTLHKLMEIAGEQLDHVYTGNTGLEFDANTYCPACGALLIERKHYHTTIRGMEGNRCAACQHTINGKFNIS